MIRKFTFRAQGILYVIPLREIIYLEQRKRQVLLYAEQGEYLFYATVQECMVQLDGRFVRCHRSFILNWEQVRSMGSDRILMHHGAPGIALSRKVVERTKRAYRVYRETGPGPMDPPMDLTRGKLDSGK